MKNSTKVRLQAGPLAVANVLLQQILIVHTLSPLSGYARKAGALMGMGNYKEALKVCKVP
jgi:hypothetical protein